MVAFTMDPGPTPEPRPGLQTPTVGQRRIYTALEADETLDKVYMARRSIDGTGGWTESAWTHYVGQEGHLILRKLSADALMGDLAGVGELAVRITHEYGEDTAAVFTVRHLNAALESDVVNWDC